MKKITILIFLLLGAAVNAKDKAPAVAPDEGLWTKIDQLNRKIVNTKKPISEEAFANLLQEAVALLRSKEMENDYEKIRAAAFKNDDFTIVDKLEARAQPGIFVTYQGDWARREVSFETFKSLVTKNSNLDKFLNSYEKYTLYLFDKSPIPSFEQGCLAIEFDVDRGDDPYENKLKSKLKPFVADLQNLRKTLKQKFLLSAIDLAIKCLESQ